MGIALPQVVTSDRASGTQVIDGSLKFDGAYLNKTWGSAPTSSTTQTFSYWVKLNEISPSANRFPGIFGGNGSTGGESGFSYRSGTARIKLELGGGSKYIDTTQVFRDIGWYHIAGVYDTTQATDTDRLKLYVNGERVTDISASSYPTSSQASGLLSNTKVDQIGAYTNGTNTGDFNLTQFYGIDGLALGPGYFGFTDPLTGTWRPKKFKAEGTTVNDGTQWSSLVDVSNATVNNGSAANLFDGDTTTKINITGGYIEIDLSSRNVQAGPEGIEVYNNEGGAYTSYQVNGGTAINWQASAGWMSMGGVNSKINTIRINHLSGGGVNAAFAFRVNGVTMVDSTTTNLAFGTNGFYLPMDGNSPIGEDKSGIVTINDGRTWSATATISSGGAASNKELSNGFDGSVATAFEGDTSGATVTVPVSATISAGGVRVYAAVTSGNPLVVLLKNGGTTVETINGANSGGQWYASSSYAGAITSLIISRTGRAPEFNGIEIGGITLIDNVVGNSWTPVNFGGSVALDNPQVSGARPILNVTQGGTQAGVGVFGSKENQTIEVTVSNASGNNRYYFDGSLTPNLAFTRGSTITFHTTNNGNVSGDGHPFKLSSTNASGSAGTEYSDGVAYYINGSVVSGSDYVSNYSGGAASGFRGIKWTVPHNQSTTYYYCTIHTGMGNNGALTSTIDETKADPYAWKNVLALPLVGSDDDVSNSVNSGSTTKVTASTNAVASSAASNFYGRSWIFDGSGDYIAVTDNADLAFGTGDHTVELWVYPNTLVSNDCLYDGRQSTGSATTGFSIVVNSSGQVQTYTAGGYRCSSTAQLKVGKWSHIAVVRSSGTDTLFMDGIAQADTDATNGNYTDQKCRIGSDVNGDESWGGHISDFRLYKGVAKYTSNFVPAAASPDILPDTPSGVAGGSKLAKITEGAVTGFETTSDYLSLAASSDFLFDGDHTIEFFGYFNTLSNSAVPYSTGTSGTPDQIYISDAGGMNYGYGQTGALSAPAGTIGTNKWYHIAVSKQGTNLRMFVDGIIVASSTNHSSTIGSSSNGPRIGARRDGYHPTQGFISNLRIVKGTALYTANFTPPTAPLTNVTNTKLLCCQSNTSAITAAVTPGTIINSISSFKENTSSTNQTWDNSSAASSTSSALGPDKLFWSDLGAAKSINKVSFDVIASGQSGDTSTNFVIYHSTSTSSTGNSVCGSGCNQITTPITTGTSPGTYSVTINFPAAVSARYVAITNGSGGSGGTYVFSNVSIEPNATATTFNPFNTDINTVRGQETGYATWNLLDKSTNTTLSDGNLNFKSSSGWSESKSTIKIPTTGKWYVEQIYRGGSSNLSPSTWNARYSFFGVCTNNYVFGNAGGDNCLVLSDTNFISKFGTQTAALGAVTKGPGGTVSLALNRDDNTYEFFYQGVSIDSGTIGTTDSELFFMVGHYPGNTTSFDFNFGQKPFKFPPPAGFQPLNGANVKPETVIVRPDQYVGATIYDGNGGTKNVSTNHSPDLVWIKHRTRSQAHVWYDSVRTAGTGKALASNSTGAEGAQSDGTTYGYLSAFNNNGFTVIKGSDGEDYVNKNATSYVAWSWKAGGNKNTFNIDDVGYASAAAAGLTGGTITPTGASVGTKQGFSITTFTTPGSGTFTYSHGLTQSPTFIITKARNQSYTWTTYHVSAGATKYLVLNTQGAAEPGTMWNNTTPSSSVVYGNSSNFGTSTNYVTYQWHDVPGLQKFGSFEANQSADGPFIELGFRPAVVWIKNIDNYDPPYDWVIYDNARSTNNPNDKFLCANLGNVENSGSGGTDNARYVDFLSNGFKVRTASTSINLNAHTQIYCAWAEAPEFNLYGGQSNAR